MKANTTTIETEPLTPEQQAFLAAYKRGDFAAGVALARQAVRKALYSVTFELDQPAPDLLCRDDSDPRAATVDKALHIKELYASYLVGIAVGQLMHPDVFKSAADGR